MWRRRQRFLLIVFYWFGVFYLVRVFVHKNRQLTLENITIEQALQQIPICSSNDRRQQRILLTLFQAWCHFAEKHKIQYWLAYGSLVGYVRQHGLLPHDQDIDVIMMPDEIPKLINISQTEIFGNYQIKVQPQWYIIEKSRRSYFRDQGIHFIAPNARFVEQINGYYVDIFPIYTFNPLYSNRSIEKTQSNNLTIYGRHFKWLSIPRTFVYPLKVCYFSGIQTLCPAKPEDLVATLYGSSALTNSDKKCENGTWVRVRL